MVTITQTEKDRILSKVTNHNLAVNYWRAHKVKVYGVIDKFIGKKVKLASGATSKPFKEAMDKVLPNEIERMPSISSYVEVSDYSVIVHIKVCYRATNSTVGYYPIYVYVGDVRNGILMPFSGCVFDDKDVSYDDTLKNFVAWREAEDNAFRLKDKVPYFIL